MKKFLCGLAFLLVAGFASAQTIPVWVMWSSSWVRWDGGPVGNGPVGPYSGTPVLGDIIYFNGTNWVSLGIGSTNNVLTVVGGLPSWQAAAGGSAFSAITSGTNTTAAMVVGTGSSLTTSGSGSITASAVAVTGVTGLGTGVATWLATPTAGNLSAAITKGCFPSVTQVCVFDDFTDGSSATAAAAAGTFFRCSSNGGTGAGCNSALSAGTATATADTNTVGIWEITDGTTNTGFAAITSAGSTGAASTASLVLSGGEDLQSRIFVPTVSVVTTAQFQTGIAFCDNLAACTNGIILYWDQGVNSNWVAKTINTGTGAGNTTSTSNTAASGGTWWTLRIHIDAALANAHFYACTGAVTGQCTSELNVSPISTNIPGIGSSNHSGLFIQPVFNLAIAGTTARWTDIDYTMFQKAVSR